MRQLLSRVAIIGPGLLGGSIGLACKDQGYEVSFWGRNEERLTPVREAGFTASTDLKQVIANADLIILAIPVPYMAQMSEQLIEAGLTKGQLVTDVGSVKHAVVEAVQPVLSTVGYQFIGSHPMAGSEQQGFSAAKASILQEAMCIVTPDSYSELSQLERLRSFWGSLGMKVTELTTEQHDEIVSRVSHVPHLLASVCAHVALPKPGNGQYAGGGLKDTSRVASGDPELWTGIVSENSAEIVTHLGEAIERLQEYQRAISKEDLEGLKELLTQDKLRRDGYYASGE